MQCENCIVKINRLAEVNKYLIKTSEGNVLLVNTVWKTDGNKIDYHQRIQRYVCVDIIPFPWDEVELVMLIRAYGGCLGTKSR